VLVAMKRYSENGANNIILNELACWCLSTLCRLKESAVLVAHAGGIKQVSFGALCIAACAPWQTAVVCLVQVLDAQMC